MMNGNRGGRLAAMITAVLIATVGAGAFLAYSGGHRIYTASGARFLSTVEKVADEARTPFSRNELSPLSTTLTGVLAKAGDGNAARAQRLLGAASFGLLLLLLFSAAAALMPWYFALSAALLFALHPQVVQPMAETTTTILSPCR